MTNLDVYIVVAVAVVVEEEVMVTFYVDLAVVLIAVALSYIASAFRRHLCCCCPCFLFCLSDFLCTVYINNGNFKSEVNIGTLFFLFLSLVVYTMDNDRIENPGDIKDVLFSACARMNIYVGPPSDSSGPFVLCRAGTRGEYITICYGESICFIASFSAVLVVHYLLATAGERDIPRLSFIASIGEPYLEPCQFVMTFENQRDLYMFKNGLDILKSHLERLAPPLPPLPPFPPSVDITQEALSSIVFESAYDVLHEMVYDNRAEMYYRTVIPMRLIRNLLDERPDMESIEREMLQELFDTAFNNLI